MYTRHSMTVNGLCCTIHQPPELQQRFVAGREVEQGLPPYAPVSTYVVDDYDASCPSNWERGGPNLTSCFVGLKVGRGVWFDFNQLFSHTHHVAVVVSIQGINAVTGLPAEDAGMQQYRVACPVHQQVFGAARFCKECGYLWPAQNYLATTGAPQGLLWIDGFRAQDGVVRQFTVTEDVARGIAAQLIGEKRVFAFGFSFFLSREPKPRPVHVLRRGVVLGSQGDSGFVAYATGSSPGARAKQLEIGGGAKIHQHIHPDPNELSFWHEKPAGVIYLNYADEDTVRRIIAAGASDRTAGGEGFMKGLLTGTPKTI